MAKKRSTAVVVRRVSVSRARRRSNGNGFGSRIPVAIVAGALPNLARAYAARSNGATGADGWGDILLRGYTGFSPSQAYGKGYWSAYWLQFGAIPLALGFLAHGLANKTGINRMIRRLVPLVEV